MSFFFLLLIEGSSIFSKETIRYNEFNTETEISQGELQEQGGILCYIFFRFMTLHGHVDEH
jgi:hypothetical protein